MIIIEKQFSAFQTTGHPSIARTDITCRVIHICLDATLFQQRGRKLEGSSMQDYWQLPGLKASGGKLEWLLGNYHHVLSSLLPEASSTADLGPCKLSERRVQRRTATGGSTPLVMQDNHAPVLLSVIQNEERILASTAGPAWVRKVILTELALPYSY